MKKIISIIIVSVILTSLCACANRNKAYIFNTTDGNIVEGISDEIEFLKKREKKASMPETKQITFDGKTYDTVYDESVYSPYYNCDYDAYEYSGDGVGISFDLDSKTGEIVGWARYLRNSTRELTPEEMNESDERLAIAKKFVEENTTGEYELTWDNGEANVKTKSEGILHTFFFNKRISGLLTADKICVTVNSLGEICSYRKYMIMDGVSELKIDAERSRKVAEKRLEKITDENTEYEIFSEYVTRLRNGDFGTEYNVRVTKNGLSSIFKMFVYN